MRGVGYRAGVIVPLRKLLPDVLRNSDPKSAIASESRLGPSYRCAAINAPVGLAPCSTALPHSSETAMWNAEPRAATLPACAVTTSRSGSASGQPHAGEVCADERIRGPF